MNNLHKDKSGKGGKGKRLEPLPYADAVENIEYADEDLPAKGAK